jgi:hypothetical protein
MKPIPGVRRLIRPLYAAIAVVAVAGCATVPAEPPTGSPGAVRDIPIPGTPEARREPALPAIPDVDGPLRLEVGYPRIDAPRGGPRLELHLRIHRLRTHPPHHQ